MPLRRRQKNNKKAVDFLAKAMKKSHSIHFAQKAKTFFGNSCHGQKILFGVLFPYKIN